MAAEDAYGNVATGYAGTVRIATNDAQVVPPANATLASGIKYFSITLKTVQSTTITATDITTPSITGSTNPISVVSNAAFNFSSKTMR